MKNPDETNPIDMDNRNAPAASKVRNSLKVNVHLLDTLMNLAGELVLSRNQLVRGLASSDTKSATQSSQRIDMITSELQEAIMKTRMQPISHIFNKFTRVVRDMGRELGKSIDLEMDGKEVELDKTILEAVSDPLTRLLKNSADHGIETPDVREGLGKHQTGKISLNAFHDAGQVHITVSDDGKGIDPDAILETALAKGIVSENQVSGMSEKDKFDLILQPGFSTARTVTDVSGQDDGMDVVVTKIESLGGVMEINSTHGQGTRTQIKLPLTLAIIPSQMISVGRENFAVPQVNLDELIRIPAARVKERVEKVGDAEVVRLRGNLLPLVNLSGVLNIQKTYTDPQTGEVLPDRRQNVADRRSKRHGHKETLETEAAFDPENMAERRTGDRRIHADSALGIAVVSTGSCKYGLVVDDLLDSEEIVVKPLGRHLKNCELYAGATIMGNGRVALILDISNLARSAELDSVQSEKAGHNNRNSRNSRSSDKTVMLTFQGAENEYFGVPLHLVERIEKFSASEIEDVGSKKIIQYRGGALPLYEIGRVADAAPLPEQDRQEVIVFNVKNREIGLMVTPPVNTIEVVLNVDVDTFRQPGIRGSMILEGKTVLLIDIMEFGRHVNPDWFKDDR